MRRKGGGLGLLPVVEVAELVIELYYSKAAFSVLIASGAHTLHLLLTPHTVLLSSRSLGQIIFRSNSIFILHSWIYSVGDFIVCRRKPGRR